MLAYYNLIIVPVYTFDQQALVSTVINWTGNDFSIWINNYIYLKLWVVITDTCPNFNSGLA